MTTQTVHIHTFDYGASLSSATLRNIADDTLVATADTVNEVTADSGLYAAVFGETAVISAGSYRLRAVIGGPPINLYVTLAGTNNEVVQSRSERLAELDSASVTAVQSGLALEVTSQSIKSKTDNLPSDPADQSLIIAATDAVMTRLGSPDGASMSADIAAVKTDTGNLATRITANLFSGITYLSRWLGALAGKTADTTTRAEINATTAGAGYNETTDSQEAIRDRGDSAWITGSGGGGVTLAEIISGVQSVSGAIVEAQNSASLSIRIGDTWTQGIGSLGDLTGKTVTFAMKKRASDSDNDAIVFITEGTGLTRLNGAATTAGWGSIEITDEVAGDIVLRLESDATSLLTSGSYVDAVKVLSSGSDLSLRNAGRTVVSQGVIAQKT